MQRTSTTLQDVAREAGVSKTTAASILRNERGFQVSEATRKRVLAAAAHLSYRRNALAAALASGRTHTVGILLPPLLASTTPTVSRTYGQDVFVAVLKAASRDGLRVMPFPLPETPGEMIPVRELVDGRVDGLVMVSLRDRHYVDQLYASGIACVEMSSGYGKRLIHPDNEGGAAAAVAYLVGLGHRRIAHWRGGVSGNYASVHRQSGFVAAVAGHGLRSEDCPVLGDVDSVTALLRRPPAERPTALFAFNDYQAFMVLDIARGLGLRVPDDLSVVGFDDGVLAEAARPMLTTVRNPLEEQALAAITVLQALWRGEPEPPIPPAVPTRLVIRDSTAAPAAA